MLSSPDQFRCANVLQLWIVAKSTGVTVCYSAFYSLEHSLTHSPSVMQYSKFDFCRLLVFIPFRHKRNSFYSRRASSTSFVFCYFLFITLSLSLFLLVLTCTLSPHVSAIRPFCTNSSKRFTFCVIATARERKKRKTRNVWLPFIQQSNSQHTNTLADTHLYRGIIDVGWDTNGLTDWLAGDE